MIFGVLSLILYYKNAIVIEFGAQLANTVKAKASQNHKIAYEGHCRDGLFR